MVRFCQNHWFLLALGLCFCFGAGLSEQVQFIVASVKIRGALVFTVMFLMGVTLKPHSIRRSLTRPFASLLAIAINVFWVPALSLPFFWLLSNEEFGGLFVATLVPGTLASASVWTRKAGGEDAIAMMNTVVTNLACVVIVPIGVWLVLSQHVDVSATAQMWKLTWLVVLPLIFAQAARWKLGKWADTNRPKISKVAQVGILAMVMIGAASSARMLDSADGWLTQVPMIVLTASIHTGALFTGIGLARSFRMPPEHQIAVGISGSQKTLMVGLQVAIDCGVSVIPMLVFHISQLIIDTVVVSRWNHEERSSPFRRESTEEQIHE